MTKLGVVQTYFVINYYLGPLNDTVCQMGRVMRWETWSTTCGVIRSTGCWLSLGCHDNHLAIGLCDCVRGCRNELVAAFGSQSWGWRTTPSLPPIPLSLLSPVKGENMTLHLKPLVIAQRQTLILVYEELETERAEQGFSMAEDWR